MIHPSASEIASLREVAREIRETTDAYGYSVEVAVDQHESFGRSVGPARVLERSLILDAARAGAKRAGLGTKDVSGGLDIVATSADSVRFYRVKRMELDADGGYRVLCGEGSSLLVSDPDSFWREEKWVLGYLTTDDHTIDRIVAAEIVDWRGNGPVQLKFGRIIDLSDDPAPRGFVSTDEGLEGFDEDSADGGAQSA